MIGVLATIGVALVALPALLAPRGENLHPADWARWVAATLVAGALAIQTALWLAAAPTVLRATGVHGLSVRCARMAGAIPAGGPAVGWFAALSGLFLPAIGVVAFVRGRSTQRRVAAAAMLAPVDQRLGADVRLMRANEPVALSVADNGGGHVVVSCGLVRALTDDQLAAVVRHERAHLRHRHGSYLLLASCLETGLVLHPLVRRSTAVLRGAVERWADEDAAGCSSDGRQATRTALLAAVFAENPLSVAGFGPIDTVVDRVAALQRPAPRSSVFARVLATAPLALLVLSAVTSAGMAGGRLWTAIAMPVTCRLGLT